MRLTKGHKVNKIRSFRKIITTNCLFSLTQMTLCVDCMNDHTKREIKKTFQYIIYVDMSCRSISSSLVMMMVLLFLLFLCYASVEN